MTGTGTQNDPFIVTTMAEFVAKIETAGVYIELANDLDCTEWQPVSNHQYVMACNQIDGKGYAIKNPHVLSDDYDVGIMFRLSPANQNGVMKNLHWKNVYLNGVCLFITNSNRYGYYWNMQNCSFSCELFNGRFLQTDYVCPRFKNCAVYLYCGGTSCDPITGDYYDTSSYIFDTCAIEINGTVSYHIFSGQLVNSRLSGNVTLRAGGNSAIEIFNQGDQAYSNSVIDMTVKCSEAWNVNNYSLYATGLLINTSRLQNVSLTGVTDIFIVCDDEEMVDSEWLMDEGFDVGTYDVGFVWHDWLMNGNDVRVSQLDYSAGGTFNYTVDGSADTYSATIELANNTYCISEPFADNQWYTYYFNAQSGHKYKVTLSGTTSDGIEPFASFARNGSSWLADFTAWEGVIKAPDSTSTVSVRLGARNRSGNTLSGTFTYTNVTIVGYSDWVVVNGKLINSSLPDIPVLGAFCNARNLTKIEIPATVKKIGRYAFTNTLLSEVTIASDCDYYDTSFPAGCVVRFY